MLFKATDFLSFPNLLTIQANDLHLYSVWEGNKLCCNVMRYFNYQRTLTGRENGYTSRGDPPPPPLLCWEPIKPPPQHSSAAQIQIKTSPSETIFKQLEYRYDRRAGT